LKNELQEALEKEGPAFPWSLSAAKLAWRGVKALVAEQTAVRMSVGRLLEGQEIKGKFDEVRWLVKQLSGGVDKLGAQLDGAKAFEGGEIRIFAPGSKQKFDKKKPNTPPSEW
jgi:hypothetical protein